MPAKKEIVNCLYCANHPDGEEHWLPVSLGAFKGNTKLRGRICTPCNVRLGQTIDDELAHAGPTGFARQLLAIRGRSGQDKKNVFDFKASQIEPPIQIYKGADDSHQTLLQAISRNVDGTFKAVERRHLTVEMTDGRREALPFPIGWRADQLRSAAEKRGLLGGRVVRAHAAPPESAVNFRDTAKDTIREVFGPSAFEVFESNVDSEPQPIEPTLVRFNLSPEYLRAVAKVAFHYFLWACPQIGGDESDFSAIRDFVSSGTGDVNRFLQRHENRIDRVSTADGGTIEPCHMFVAYASQAEVLVTLHFFSQAAGPQFPTFAARLGHRPAALPTGRCRGHIAVYSSAVTGHAGELRELEIPE